jgi:hypothetical protein
MMKFDGKQIIKCINEMIETIHGNVQHSAILFVFGLLIMIKLKTAKLFSQPSSIPWSFAVSMRSQPTIGRIYHGHYHKPDPNHHDFPLLVRRI